MPESEYRNLPNEPIWAHAHRLLITYFLGAASHIVLSTPGMASYLDQPVGAYIFSYQRLKGALLALYSSRERLHKIIHWERRPSGEWVSQLIRASDDETLEVMAGANIAFAAFVQAWQPVMDSIAEIIELLLRCKGSPACGTPKSMIRLVKCAKVDDWAERYPTLSRTLLEATGWYVDEVRIKRNQFVHNQRVVSLLPEPGSDQTVVEMKATYNDTTTERFRMDKFVNWTLGKFLLFTGDLAEASKELCRK